MINAVLWDNDGVLVDPETLFFDVTHRAFAELGVALTRAIWGKRYLSDGIPSREIAAQLGADPSRIAQVLDDRNRHYRAMLAQSAALRPRVRETLTALAGRVRQAIVTGCDREQLNLVHRSTDLLRFFELVVTSDDCTHAKPHPELYLTAIKALNLSPNECIAIEDSPRGVASATAAGVACMAVPTELTADLNFDGAISIEEDASGVLARLPALNSPLKTFLDPGCH